MKKTTLMLCAFIASAGLMTAQQVQLPAAYNNNTPAVQEMAIPLQDGSSQRNPNVNIPFTGTYGSSASNRTADVIFDNGPYFNVAGNPDLSVLESVTLGMGTYGPSASYAAGYSVADDVILTEGYDISSIEFFAYQTNEIAPTISQVYVQVWEGDPSAGGTVVWGDLVIGIIGGASYANANRVLESDQSATNRQINRVIADTDGLTLDPGSYWIEWSFEGFGASGPWAAPVVILGESTTGNAMQFNGTDWTGLLDGGTSTPYGLPFIMYGTPTVGVKDNVLAGFSFYPNPTQDVLNLKANNTIESVTLFNLLGQKVMTVKVDATTSNINIGTLAKGNYIMQVTVEGQTGTFKVTRK